MKERQEKNFAGEMMLLREIDMQQKVISNFLIHNQKLENNIESMLKSNSNKTKQDIKSALSRGEQHVPLSTKYKPLELQGKQKRQKNEFKPKYNSKILNQNFKTSNAATINIGRSFQKGKKSTRTIHKERKQGYTRHRKTIPLLTRKEAREGNILKNCNLPSEHNSVSPRCDTDSSGSDDTAKTSQLKKGERCEPNLKNILSEFNENKYAEKPNKANDGKETTSKLSNENGSSGSYSQTNAGQVETVDTGGCFNQELGRDMKGAVAPESSKSMTLTSNNSNTIAAKDELPSSANKLERNRKVEKEKETLLRELTHEYCDCFRSFVFCKWGRKDYLPALVISPYDVEPGELREFWMKTVQSAKHNNRPIPHFIYWYGVEWDERNDGAYSFIPKKNLLSLEIGIKKGLDKIPRVIQKKIDKRKALSNNETFHLKALEYFNKDRCLPPKDRILWMRQFGEKYSSDIDYDSVESYSANEDDKEIENNKNYKRRGRPAKSKTDCKHFGGSSLGNNANAKESDTNEDDEDKVNEKTMKRRRKKSKITEVDEYTEKYDLDSDDSNY